MRKTKANYEEYLNEITAPFWQYDYLGKKGCRLVKQGRLGTALRKYDPILFQVGFEEWQDEMS